MRALCAEFFAAYFDYATGPERTCRWANTRRSLPDATTDIAPVVAILRRVACTIAMNGGPAETAKVRVWFRSSVPFSETRTRTVFLNWLRDPNLVERLRRMKFPSVTISCLHTRHLLRAKIIHSISEENTTFAWR